MDDAKLRTIWQQRQPHDRIVTLSQPLAILMKRELARKARQLGKLATIWDEVIPEEIASHTALESLSGGVLTVLVDSSSHRFQLDVLLRGGLLREIRSRFDGALNRIKLQPGQFAAIEV